jgi:hypothetical protein
VSLVWAPLTREQDAGSRCSGVPGSVAEIAVKLWLVFGVEDSMVNQPLEFFLMAHDLVFAARASL